ncbi:MAG: DUF1573 domain-containing protein [Chitinophagaceae bacterium]|nr:DUF1573 domain-containing protein [Chitinophagaceae bacterium]
MRIFLAITGIFLLINSSSAQQRIASPAAKAVEQKAIEPGVIKFTATEHDFGKIPQGKPVTHVFEFKNTGSSPLILSNVVASCGCTTPEWSKDAIAPGETSKIVVGYDSQALGGFSKPVTVFYNEGQQIQLLISGEVWQTPVTSAPENNAISQFKKKQIK